MGKGFGDRARRLSLNDEFKTNAGNTRRFVQRRSKYCVARSHLHNKCSQNHVLGDSQTRGGDPCAVLSTAAPATRLPWRPRRPAWSGALSEPAAFKPGAASPKRSGSPLGPPRAVPQRSWVSMRSSSPPRGAQRGRGPASARRGATSQWAGPPHTQEVFPGLRPGTVFNRAWPLNMASFIQTSYGEFIIF